MILTRLHDALVDETAAEVADWCEPKWGQNVSITLTIFNLTNAKDLQTIDPAPKPHFDAVEVNFTQMSKSFDCSSLEDGEKIKYHDWSKWVPTNPEVYNWEFVQVNPAYLGTIGALAPSEALLLVGLSHTILGSVKTAMDAFGGGVLLSGSRAELAVGASLNETLSTAEDVGAAQFGTSAVTNLIGAAAAGISPPSLLGFSSVASDPKMKAAGVCTPIELSTYMNDHVSGPFAQGGMLANLLLANGFEFASFSMSSTEAKAFMSRFPDATGAEALGAPNWAAVLGSLAKSYAGAALASDTAAAGTYASQLYSATSAPGALFAPTYGTLKVKHLATGNVMSMCSSSAGGHLCPMVAAAYAGYLTSYLPEKFFVGCQLLGCADGSCMRDDGTYPLNSGLFTRLSLSQMLHDGNSDRLFAVAPKEAVPPGVKLEYNGLLGKYAFMNSTLDDLRAGEADLTQWSNVQLSGKSDVTQLREWVEYQGHSLVKEGDEGYPGWGTDGTPGQPFDFAGLKYLNNQAPQTSKNSPFAMSLSGHLSHPAFGSSIDFHLTTVKWPVSLGCGAGGSSPHFCAFHKVKGIQTQKFTVPSEMLKTKKAGVVTESCRGTVSKSYAATYPGTTSEGPSCDFLQRHDGVINLAVARGGAPLAVTHGFLGQTDVAVRDAVSITRPGDSSEIMYDASKDELALFVEPITGAVITGYERLQMNWYIERSLIDTARYSNIFSAETDNNDVFVWPFMYIKKEPAITDTGAEDFISLVYGAYDKAFLLDLVGLLMALTCALLIFVCRQPNYAKNLATTTGRPANQVKAAAAATAVAAPSLHPAAPSATPEVQNEGSDEWAAQSVFV